MPESELAPPLLPVNRVWFDAHASGFACEEYRAATARWKRSLLDRRPQMVCFVNGYRADSPRVFRKVLDWELVPLEELHPAVIIAHGFTGPAIRLLLGEVVHATTSSTAEKPRGKRPAAPRRPATAATLER